MVVYLQSFEWRVLRFGEDLAEEITSIPDEEPPSSSSSSERLLTGCFPFALAESPVFREPDDEAAALDCRGFFRADVSLSSVSL